SSRRRPRSGSPPLRSRRRPPSPSPPNRRSRAPGPRAAPTAPRARAPRPTGASPRDSRARARALRRTTRPSPAQGGPGRSPRPERAAEEGEEERSVGAERVHLGGEGLPVALGQRLERLDVARAVHREDDARSVRPKHAGRQAGVGEAKPRASRSLPKA